jgi:hypothetical protein
LEQRLAEGEEIKAKDLRKLMRSYEKAEREKSKEPEVVSNYSYVEDSTVTIIRDTSAWADIRPVPLTDQEVLAYRLADSVQKKAEALKVEVNVNDDSDGSGVKVNAENDRERKNPHQRFSFFPDPFFNPVEGYALGGRIGWKDTKKKISLGLTPRYGLSWNRLSWQTDLRLGRSGINQKPRFKLSGGRFLRQFNDKPAIEPWISTFANLFNGKNYIRLYERAYGQFEYLRKYDDAFTAGVTVAYEDRRAVSNTSEQTWFGKDEAYAPNIPINAELGAINAVSPAATAQLDITWRPGLDYRIENGKKRLIENTAPTITAKLRGGLPGIGNSTADFTQLEAGFQRRFSVGRKGQVDFLVRGGAFLNNESVDFPDFKHFSTSEIIITSLDPIGSYRLLPYYLESTNQEYLEVYGHYQFRKFLLTQIWKLHLMGLKEDLFVNYLHTPTSDNYTEVGYSIDNILRIFRVEFVSSFRDFKYDDFGVRMSVASTFGRQ